jgi:hypothetical protein
MVPDVPLTSLNPRWARVGGEGIFNADGTPAVERLGVGISFDCPCDICVGKRNGTDSDFYLRHTIMFDNPLDGQTLWEGSPNRPTWRRKGETFETLVTAPSILSDVAKGGCGWHGYIGGPGGDKPGIVVTL